MSVSFVPLSLVCHVIIRNHKLRGAGKPSGGKALRTDGRMRHTVFLLRTLAVGILELLWYSTCPDRKWIFSAHVPTDAALECPN